MDSDFNQYDLNHCVSHHPRMSDQEWKEAYREAHKSFYSFAHMSRIFNRMMQMRTNQPFTTLSHLFIYREGPKLEKVAFSEYELLRIVRRNQRRHGMKIESPLIFYPGMALRYLHKFGVYATTLARLRLAPGIARTRHRLGYAYTDAAIAPIRQSEIVAIVMETEARSTPSARKRQQKRLDAQMESAGAGSPVTAEPK